MTNINSLEPEATPIGQVAVRWAGWTLLFRVLAKGLALSSQFVLASYLMPGEVGLAAMARD